MNNSNSNSGRENINDEKNDENITSLENITISKELLKNIRNLLEITNSRIHWKTDELLPVGFIIKQIDELLPHN